MQAEFDKIMPKLNVGTHMSQSLLYGQREVKSDLQCLHAKVDWLKNNLCFQAPVDSSNPSDSPDLVPTPFVYTPHANSSENSLSGLYDPLKTRKGMDRKRVPANPLLNRPFSSSNITSRDFWYEFKYIWGKWFSFS